jgi:hypothetical protein
MNEGGSEINMTIVCLLGDLGTDSKLRGHFGQSLLTVRLSHGSRALEHLRV